MRWTCPFCDDARRMYVDDDEGESAAWRRVRTALRSHIVACAGDGHGPRNELPADFDPETLDQYVDFVPV